MEQEVIIKPKTDINKNVLLERLRIDPTADLKEPPTYCFIEGRPVMTAGSFSLITGKAKSGKTFLMGSIVDQPQSGTKVWFDIDELCIYIPDKPAKATVYGCVHNKVIPHHKGQKKLRFLKPEIDTWLHEGRKKTISEIEADAGQNLKIRRAQK